MVEETTGYEKAAILLLTLGEDLASEILKNLDAKEVRLISNYLSKTKKVDPDQVRGVVKEFCELIQSFDPAFLASDEYLKTVLTKALGQEKAKEILETLAIALDDKGLESLKWLDPRGIASLIRNEHPQIIAVILAHLDPDQASKVVTLLPESLRSDVMLRLATLESVSPNVVKEIEDVLSSQLMMGENVINKKIGGPEVVASILNYIDRANETAILNSIEQTQPNLAEKIRRMMFIFEDLLNVDDRGIQAILKEVNKEDLVLALKGAGDDMKEKIFRNMSERAAQALKEDLEAKGPVRLSEIEKAQQEILKVARRLEEEGKIIIGGKGGDDVVL